jgi:transposase-like protein
MKSGVYRLLVGAALIAGTQAQAQTAVEAPSSKAQNHSTTGGRYCTSQQYLCKAVRNTASERRVELSTS